MLHIAGTILAKTSLPSDAELIATDDGIGNGLEIPADSTMCTPESILEGGWRCNEEAPNNEKQGSPAAQPRKIAAISPMADGLVGAAQSMLATLDAQIASAKEFLLTATAAKVAAAALVPRVKPGRPTNAAQLGKADRPVGVGSIRHFFKPTTAPVFHAPSPPPAAPQMPLPELAGLAPAAETEVGQGVLHPGGPRPRPRKAARTGEEGSAPAFPRDDDDSSDEGGAHDDSPDASCSEGKDSGDEGVHPSVVDRELEPELFAVVEKFKGLTLDRKSDAMATPSLRTGSTEASESGASAGAGSDLASRVAAVTVPSRKPRYTHAHRAAVLEIFHLVGTHARTVAIIKAIAGGYESLSRSTLREWVRVERDGPKRKVSSHKP